MGDHDDGDLDEAGLGEDVAVPGETEAEKRKRRQERHRTLERKRREKTQGLLNAIQAEIEVQTGQRQPSASNFTLNKALNHVVNHVKKLKDIQVREEVGESKVTKFAHPPGASDSAEADFDLVRAAVLGCDMPIVWVCMDGGIIESNVAFEELLGYPSHELKGNTFYMHSVPEDMANLMSAVCNLITEQSTKENKTVRLIHKDGSYVQTTLHLCSGKFEEKTYIVVYVVSNDRQHQPSSLSSADTPPHASFPALASSQPAIQSPGHWHDHQPQPQPLPPHANPKQPQHPPSFPGHVGPEGTHVPPLHPPHGWGPSHVPPAGANGSAPPLTDARHPHPPHRPPHPQGAEQWQNGFYHPPPQSSPQFQPPPWSYPHQPVPPPSYSRPPYYPEYPPPPPHEYGAHGPPLPPQYYSQMRTASGGPVPPPPGFSGEGGGLGAPPQEFMEGMARLGVGEEGGAGGPGWGAPLEGDNGFAEDFWFQDDGLEGQLGEGGLEFASDPFTGGQGGGDTAQFAENGF